MSKKSNDLLDVIILLCSLGHIYTAETILENWKDEIAPEHYEVFKEFIEKKKAR